MLGIFLGTLPLIAIHSIAILFFATRLRLNRFIALNISHLCMPPIVPALCIQTGHYILYGEFIVLNKNTISNLWNHIHVYIVDYLFGSIITAPIFAGIIGTIVFIILFIIKKIINHNNKRKGYSIDRK